ncbi:MAG TPA: hypothetical protein VHM70_09020 [Polyangiaceae bacterium]|jgi:hypothetical protein|nr:hypothetical protein [Polyangiaceae bacterium]
MVSNPPRKDDRDAINLVPDEEELIWEDEIGPEHPSGRPTLVPSVSPQAHANRVFSKEGAVKTSVPELELKYRPSEKSVDGASQKPTIPPPSLAHFHLFDSSATESQRPTAADVAGSSDTRSALDFVDGHARDSLSPAHASGNELPELESLEPGPNDSLADLYAVGNFSGALEIAEKRLQVNADDDEALRYLDECRRTLIRMYSARLAPLDRAVQLAVAPGEIRWLTLDHRAGFLISHVDGASTVEDLLDISGMPRLDALRILVELVSRGVVVFR